jgi:hypothetical protein
MAGKDILFPFTVAASLNSPELPVIARTHLNRRMQRIPLRHRQMLFAKDELGYLSSWCNGSPSFDFAKRKTTDDLGP